MFTVNHYLISTKPRICQKKNKKVNTYTTEYLLLLFKRSGYVPGYDLHIIWTTATTGSILQTVPRPTSCIIRAAATG